MKGRRRTGTAAILCAIVAAMLFGACARSNLGRQRLLTREASVRLSCPRQQTLVNWQRNEAGMRYYLVRACGRAVTIACVGNDTTNCAGWPQQYAPQQYGPQPYPPQYAPQPYPPQYAPQPYPPQYAPQPYPQQPPPQGVIIVR